MHNVLRIQLRKWLGLKPEQARQLDLQDVQMRELSKGEEALRRYIQKHM